MTERALTVKEVAARFGVTATTVGLWIRSGELRAINVGRSPGKLRKRWRVTPESLAAFELSREASPPPPRTRRRKKSPDGVIQFYK